MTTHPREPYKGSEPRTSAFRRFGLPDIPSYVLDTESHLSRLRKTDEIGREKPSIVVDLPGGQKLEFFLDKHDEGVAVFGEALRDSTGFSALDHPKLQSATPAMVYHAVTGTESEVPEFLLAHHEAVVREFNLGTERTRLERRDRGWLLAETGGLQSSPCANVTFTANICDHPEYDEAVCKKDTSGNWIWYVPGAYRYKAGFCLQTGHALSWLTYEHVRWNDQLNACEGCGTLHMPWGWSDENGFDMKEWSATTYLVYVFWKGAGTSWARSFSHGAGWGAGDLFDWGQRYSWKPCQYFS